jgi:hypothetical protein
VRFTNASAIGLHPLGNGYFAMRLKPGEEKEVKLEITGGEMPNPSKQYKLSAKAGGTLLQPSSGDPPLEIPVKEGSMVSIVALGLISVNLNNPPPPPDGPGAAPRPASAQTEPPVQNDPNGYTDRRQIEQHFLLHRGIYHPEERIGAVIASFDNFRTSFVVGADSTFVIPKNRKVLSLAVNSVAGKYGAATGEFEVNVVAGEALTLPTRLTARGSAANPRFGAPALMQPGANLPQFVVDVGLRDHKRLIPRGYVAYAVYASHDEKAPPLSPGKPLPTGQTSGGVQR